MIILDVATVITLATVLPRNWRSGLFGILAFFGVGVMHWPLLWVLAAPCAVVFAWRGQE